MDPHTPQSFIIIVHYGDPAATRASIQALLGGTTVPAGILVVDHAPVPLQLSVKNPPVRVLRPVHNGGYAAGVNMGLGALSSMGATVTDMVVVMNNDTKVLPNALAELLHFYHQHPEPALVGVVTQEAQHTIYGGGVLSMFTGRAVLQTTPRHAPLDYIHGACMAAAYEVWLRLQGMPEDYFLYWEDVLLSRRAVARGMKLLVADKVVVQHRDSFATMPTSTQLYYLVRNGALFMEQETAWPVRPLWWIGNRLRYMYHVAKARLGGAPKPLVTEALRDAIRHVTGKKS